MPVDFNGLPEYRQLQNFLNDEPEQRAALRGIAVSIIGWMDEMHLPHARESVKFAYQALQFYECDDATHARLDLLTGMDRYGPSPLSAAQQEANERAVDEARRRLLADAQSDTQTGRLFAQLAGNAAIEDANRAALGLTKQKRRALVRFIADHHMEKMAEIITGAVSFALQDPACANLVEINKMTGEDDDLFGIERATPRDRYAFLVSDMTGYVAEEISREMRAVLWPEQARALKDILPEVLLRKLYRPGQP